jgi:hypothetical protein
VCPARRPDQGPDPNHDPAGASPAAAYRGRELAGISPKLKTQKDEEPAGGLELVLRAVPGFVSPTVTARRQRSCLLPALRAHTRRAVAQTSAVAIRGNRPSASHAYTPE